VLSCDDDNHIHSGVCVQEQIDGNLTCYPNVLEIDCINEMVGNWQNVWMVDMDCEEFCEEVEDLDNGFTDCDINDLES